MELKTSIWIHCFCSNVKAVRVHILMAWCKTSVTPSHLWRSYNCFAPSHLIIIQPMLTALQVPETLVMTCLTTWLHMQMRWCYLCTGVIWSSLSQSEHEIRLYMCHRSANENCSRYLLRSEQTTINQLWQHIIFSL